MSSLCKHPLSCLHCVPEHREEQLWSLGLCPSGQVGARSPPRVILCPSC